MLYHQPTYIHITHIIHLNERFNDDKIFSSITNQLKVVTFVDIVEDAFYGMMH